MHYGIDMANYDINNSLYTFNNSGEGVIYWSENGKPKDTLNVKEPLTQSGFDYNRTTKFLLSYNHNLFLFNQDNTCFDTLLQTTGVHVINNSDVFITFQLDSSLNLYQEKTQQDSLWYERTRQIKIPGTSFTSAESSPDGKYLLTTHDDSVLRLWLVDSIIETKNPQPLFERKIEAIISLVKFAPNGTLFASASDDNIIRLWNTNGDLLAQMVGHADAIEDFNFSPDCKWLVSGSFDKTVRLWDMKGNELQMYPGHNHKVKKTKFSPDGKYILSCSNDHTARLMPVSVEQVLDKINKEKVRGEVWQMGEKEREVYGIP